MPTFDVERLEPRRLFAVPSGFSETRIGPAIPRTSSMTLAPDGRIFVSEQDGDLRVIKNGDLLDEPFVTVPAEDEGERGLLGTAFDPNYAANRFVYVYYTTRVDGAARNGDGRGSGRRQRSARRRRSRGEQGSRTAHGERARHGPPHGRQGREDRARQQASAEVVHAPSGFRANNFPFAGRLTGGPAYSLDRGKDCNMARERLAQPLALLLRAVRLIHRRGVA